VRWVATKLSLAVDVTDRGFDGKTLLSRPTNTVLRYTDVSASKPLRVIGRSIRPRKATDAIYTYIYVYGCSNGSRHHRGWEVQLFIFYLPHLLSSEKLDR
jgi:hypothetical protein